MRHMTDRDRYYIQRRLSQKISVANIALELGFSRVAVYAEIKRGLCVQKNSNLTEKTVYLWDYAQRDADLRKKRHGTKKYKPDDALLLALCKLISDEKYSPYAAIQKLHCGDLICEKTLYNYIEDGYIPGMSFLSLPYAKRRKKKTSGSKKGKRREFESGRKSIEERPACVLERKERGHWEMDTVYSSKDDLHCLLVLSERYTREEIILKIKDRTSDSVIKALNGLERRFGTPAFRRRFLTITCDNGVEFSDWRGIEKSCRTKGSRTCVYFCHPYSSFERGTNENINSMVRRWIPKGDDIGLYSSPEISVIQNWINDYPRKIFNGKSSAEFASVLP